MKLRFDLHIHTRRYSPCSTIPPERLIDAARRRGLDGIAITEHGRLWSPAELAELKRAAGCPEFPVLAGCEVSTRDGDWATGDLLAYGVAAPPAAGLTIAQLCREVHRQGGVVVAPHPFAGFFGIGEAIYSAPLDALEVGNARHNLPGDAARLERARRELELPGTASSDAHALEEVGAFYTEFDAPIRDERELARAIREGRCIPRLKPPPLAIRGLFRRGK